MKKKVILYVYYAGMILGIFIMNYMLNHYIEYADSLIECLQETDHLNFINGRELYLYLLMKRLKQVIIVFVLFFQIFKGLTFPMYAAYFALIEGMFLSLCTYYYGIEGVLISGIMLLPQLCGFLIFQTAGWSLYEKMKENIKINNTKLIVLTIMVIIVMTILELIINYVVGMKIFSRK